MDPRIDLDSLNKHLLLLRRFEPRTVQPVAYGHLVNSTIQEVPVTLIFSVKNLTLSKPNYSNNLVQINFSRK